jgi:hypothetical protein
MASIIDTEYFRGKAAASQRTSGNGGGSVDDILKRLGIVESSVAEIRGDVREIKAVLPHLATKADLNALETRQIKWLIGTVITCTALAFSIAKFVN